MTDPEQLARDLAEEAPESAAGVLAEADPGEAAAFLGRLPDAAVPPLLAAMPPVSAAACLVELPAETLARWLQGVEAPLRHRVVRLLPPAAAQRLLDVLPPRLAREAGRALTHAADSVGAWMEVAAAPVRSGDTVAACLARLRRQRHGDDLPLVVVDEAGGYHGLVTLAAVLAASDRKTLGRLADTRAAPLAPDTPLDQVAGQPDWGRYLALPVVDRRRRPVGVLRRARLAEALLTPAPADAAAASSLFAHLMEAALVTGAGLGRLLVPGRAEAEAGEPGDD